MAAAPRRNPQFISSMSGPTVGSTPHLFLGVLVLVTPLFVLLALAQRMYLHALVLIVTEVGWLVLRGIRRELAKRLPPC